MPFVNGKWVEPEKTADDKLKAYYGNNEGSSGGNDFRDPHPLSPQMKALTDFVRKYDIGGTGTEFAGRMGRMINDPARMVTVNHTGIDEARANELQSYQQQQEALGMMRAQAMGEGPSLASLQGQAGQDQAVTAMMGAGAHGGLASAYQQGLGNQAANQAAGARAQEIQQAQGAWGQGADAMRGMSLQGQQQALQNAYQASQLNLSQQGQDLERRQQLERLRLSGLQMDQGFSGSLKNFNQGVLEDLYQRQQQQTNAQMGLYTGMMGGFSKYIGSISPGDNGGGRKPTEADLENPYYRS